MKLKSYKSFFTFLLLLLGDIAFKPEPNMIYPCSKCNKSVRVGIYCKTFNMWIHQRCDGLTNSELKNFSKIPINGLDFVCIICNSLPYHQEETIPEASHSFQFQEVDFI